VNKRLPLSFRIFILLSLLAIALSACSAAATPGASPAEAPQLDFGAREATSNSGVPSSDSAQAADRLVIKNASLTIVVASPQDAQDHIGKMAEEMGGFVVTSNLYQSQLSGGTEVPRASITVRVPAERLEEALNRIHSESDRAPINQTTNSQDVTKEYTDLQSRLRNSEAAEQQLTKLMDQATKTDDVLAVYTQLVQKREEIEVLKGQIQYYEQSAALSSISVDLLVNAEVQPLTIGKWEPKGVANTAIRALLSTLRFLFYAVIWIGLYVLPVGLVILIPILLLIFILRRLMRRSRKTAPLPVAGPTPPPAQG
jgi:hypothetical protein